MSVALGIITSVVTLLLGVIAYFLKRLISHIDSLTKTVDTVNNTMSLYVYKTDENTAKIIGVHGEVKELDHRMTIIETEHKTRKCK